MTPLKSRHIMSLVLWILDSS